MLQLRRKKSTQQINALSSDKRTFKLILLNIYDRIFKRILRKAVNTFHNRSIRRIEKFKKFANIVVIITNQKNKIKTYVLNFIYKSKIFKKNRFNKRKCINKLY